CGDTVQQDGADIRIVERPAIGEVYSLRAVAGELGAQFAIGIAEIDAAGPRPRPQAATAQAAIVAESSGVAAAAGRNFARVLNDPVIAAAEFDEEVTAAVGVSFGARGAVANALDDDGLVGRRSILQEHLAADRNGLRYSARGRGSRGIRIGWDGVAGD